MILTGLLLLCVMVHITVCCTADANLQCSNITRTVGSSLTLTCSVSYDINSRFKEYKWKKNGAPLEHCKNCSLLSHLSPHRFRNDTLYYTSCNSDRKCDDVTCSVTFHHTIPTASEEHSGNYSFWVQLTTGCSEKRFSVTLSGRDRQDGDHNHSFRHVAGLFMTTVVASLIVGWAV